MNIDYKAIGKRIKIARIKKEITQDKMAEKAGLSAPHISNIETGNTKLSLPAIITIANILCVSVDELLCDNINKSKSVFKKEIKDIFDECSDQEIKLAVNVLKAIIESLRKNPHKL